MSSEQTKGRRPAYFEYGAGRLLGLVHHTSPRDAEAAASLSADFRDHSEKYPLPPLQGEPRRNANDEGDDGYLV